MNGKVMLSQRNSSHPNLYRIVIPVTSASLETPPAMITSSQSSPKGVFRRQSRPMRKSAKQFFQQHFQQERREKMSR
ncbi:unnamed protein product [Caenorhabditis auriculariae]|uniref:Uncharacterized protein n=1 Tax=Caenorhabditis auriculariae TaxID=2777116 RepID=A0A8S1HHA6_9PELO|nr:unnamed protein product [Caenorhabditis auriculariae]